MKNNASLKLKAPGRLALVASALALLGLVMLGCKNPAGPAEPALSAAPTAEAASVAKTVSSQKSVAFALTSSHAEKSVWKVYDAKSGSAALVTVSAAFVAPNLTLSASGDDLEAKSYYVSVTETGKIESGRLALTVLPYEPPAPIQSAAPAASAKTVAKTGATQKTAGFILTSSHAEDSIWKVYGAESGGAALVTVSAAFAAPNLTLSASGNDLAAKIYYVSVTETGKTESGRLALTVGPYVEPGQSLTPETAGPSVSKQSSVQKSVDFTLTSAHTGSWKVYNAPEGGSPLTTVSVSFSAPNLTLTVADSDLPAGTYHISVTETDKTESHRLALTVLPYEPPAPIQSAPPAASATTVAKTGAAQKTVVFTLTSAHTGTWQVYNAPEGGSPLTMVSVSFSAPNLTLAAAGSDLPAGTYHISVTETGKTESSRLALTVGPYVEPGQSLTPDTAKPSVSKQSAVRKSVDFILTSAHTGIWKAYDALEGGSALTTVSVSFSAPNLTLTAAGSDLPAGTYYISVTETGKTESSRLALTVLPYEPPAPIKSATPTASVTIVAKTGATQETVIFTLTSVHTGTWKVYNAASGGTPLTKTIVAFSAPSLTLTSVDGDLEAKTYYVSVTEIGKTESSRLALTVGPYLDLGFLALRYEVNINAFTATPSSGAPWNAQLSGGAAIITEEGKQLVDTGGSNGYVDLGPQTGELLRSLSEFSIEIYVYVPSETSLSGNGHFIWLMSSTTQATQTQGSYMFLRASDQAFSIAKTGWGSGQTTENKGNIEKGWWKHIVVTRAADNTTTLYVNGTRISQSDAAAMTVDHSDLDALNYCYFAKPVFSGDNYLKNVRYYRLNIYNKALSSEEIVSGLGMAETLFALQKTPALQPASNLYVKTDSSEKFVSFILNNYPNASAVTVYDQASGNSQASAVTVSLNRNILTFTATGNDVPAGDYYITLTGEFARESDRTRLTVAPYVPPPKLIVISFTGIPSDPITVTGGGSISQSGGPLIISLSNAGDFTGVQWWLDGVKQASETGASYSIAVSGLSAGTHRVMVGASKNNIPYSGETSFIVTN